MSQHTTFLLPRIFSQLVLEHDVISFFIFPEKRVFRFPILFRAENRFSIVQHCIGTFDGRSIRHSERHTRPLVPHIMPSLEYHHHRTILQYTRRRIWGKITVKCTWFRIQYRFIETLPWSIRRISNCQPNALVRTCHNHPRTVESKFLRCRLLKRMGTSHINEVILSLIIQDTRIMRTTPIPVFRSTCGKCYVTEFIGPLRSIGDYMNNFRLQRPTWMKSIFLRPARYKHVILPVVSFHHRTSPNPITFTRKSRSPPCFSKI